MISFFLGMVVGLCGMNAHGAEPGGALPDSTDGLDPSEHTHGGTVEAAAIHAAAEAWKTNCGRLVAKTRSASRVPGATLVSVTYKKGPTDRNGPKYSGIEMKGELHMGEAAVQAAVLGVWGAPQGKKIDAADLAWLTELGGSCSVTSGPTVKGDAECVGHEPTSDVHGDGRVGVRYWLRCGGGMRPNRSESKMVAWVNPDQSIERVREGRCTGGKFRPSEG